MNWQTACENTTLALNLLVENSYFAQKEFSNSLSQKANMKEMCTIRLCSSRRCGHSTAIAKIAAAHFDHAIFLSPTCSSVERLKESVTKEIQIDTDYSEPRMISKMTSTKIFGYPTPENPTHSHDMTYHFAAYNSNNFSNLRGCMSEAIFVDCAGCMSKGVEEKIYSELGPSMWLNDYKFFIFVE